MIIHKLKGKAENLDFLSHFSSNDCIIPKYLYFSVNFYKKNKKKIIKKIQNNFKDTHIILRSSSINEDQVNLSNAGKYDSLIINRHLFYDNLLHKLDVFSKQFDNPNDKIIIQTLISNVDYAGVIFTKDANYNSPYYVINYDKSGKTNLITSGKEASLHNNLIIYKNFNFRNHKFEKLLKYCKKIEQKILIDRLDIEFAIKQNKVYFFQIRPLPLQKNIFSNFKYSEKDFDNFLINIEKKFLKLSNKNSLIPGHNSIFSNMADWNPAEMIGDKPNLLALSIYKELITDSIWSKQRSDYGYKDVSPNPLMFSFAGSPYIDLRTDINSFLPHQLNDKDANEIVNKYINIIKKDPSMHDKIEFEIIETCYSFLSKKRLNKLFPINLTNKYLKYLKKLTINILKNDLLEIEEKKIKLLDKEIKKIKDKKIEGLKKVFLLNDLTKKYGTLPFAGLARCAFIAQRLLNDLKELKLISELEYELFFSSLKTTTTIFNTDLAKLEKNLFYKGKFLEKYGHLRPSTYDINSLNYREGFKLYFKSIKNKKNLTSKKLQFENKHKLELLFKKHFNISFNNFIEFSSKAINLREHTKFIFSKGINEIFESLIILSKELKISRNDLSYLDIKKILNFYTNLEVTKLKNNLKNDIKKNKFEYEMMNLIKLPDIILNRKNIYTYHENLVRPNYVTLNRVIGQVFDKDFKNLNLLNDKIIKIKNADPGFDFIFNYNIKALITQFGGANSHMAIRCLELGIPGLIGIGRKNFEKIKDNDTILIDCKKKEFKLLNE